MTQRMADALLARMPKKPEGWVFPSKRSKSGHITTVAKAFAEAREAAGLPKSLVLYCARHTFGTDALGRTGDLSAVMKAMGHSSPQVTMQYLHPGLNAIRKAMENRHAETLERHNLRHSPENGSPEQRASA